MVTPLNPTRLSVDEHGLESLKINRLNEVVMEPGFFGLRTIGFLAVSRQRDEPNTGQTRKVLEVSGQFEAVHHGKTDVQKCDIR
jgi:hypothetical protein